MYAYFESPCASFSLGDLGVLFGMLGVEGCIFVLDSCLYEDKWMEALSLEKFMFPPESGAKKKGKVLDYVPERNVHISSGPLVQGRK